MLGERTRRNLRRRVLSRIGLPILSYCPDLLRNSDGRKGEAPFEKMVGSY